MLRQAPDAGAPTHSHETLTVSHENVSCIRVTSDCLGAGNRCHQQCLLLDSSLLPSESHAVTKNHRLFLAFLEPKVLCSISHCIDAATDVSLHHYVCSYHTHTSRITPTLTVPEWIEFSRHT
jgi:hypothetical protein